MAIARSSVVSEKREGTYHCVSRCVRRAHLCGYDELTGKNHDHRKTWIKTRLMDLAGIFAMDVCGYAVMSNHLHVIIRNRPDLTAEWTDEETAIRWWQLFPRRRDRYGVPQPPREEDLAGILFEEGRAEVLRQRLHSISWFMRCLNEHIARRANREDGCRGRFWEGRFQSVTLLDQAAILSCAAYVDLNPLRAGMAETPETSEFTSVRERIVANEAKKRLAGIREEGLEKPTEAQQRMVLEMVQAAGRDSWLCPLRDEGGRRGFLQMDVDEYLGLLDATGRQMVEGKARIPSELEPILERLEVSSAEWMNTVRQFGSMFHRVAGTVSRMAEAATQAGQNWLNGKTASLRAYLVSE